MSFKRKKIKYEAIHNISLIARINLNGEIKYLKYCFRYLSKHKNLPISTQFNSANNNEKI